MGFILSLIGMLALCFLSLVIGAILFALGAYEKIKNKMGVDAANRFLKFMKED